MSQPAALARRRGGSRRGAVSTFDVIVVGGGIAGLVAAAFASKGGAGVLALGGVAGAWRARADAKRLGIFTSIRAPTRFIAAGFSITSCATSASPSTGKTCRIWRRDFSSATTRFIGPHSVPKALPARHCCPTRRKGRWRIAFPPPAAIERTETPPEISLDGCTGGIVAIVQGPLRARRDDATDKLGACAEDGRRTGASRPTPWRLDAKRSLSGRRLGYDRSRV